MKLIPPRSIEANETEEDIFSYFRSYFKVNNPHEAGIITIKASSTYPLGASYRSDVSSLIREDDGTRWVSEEEKNASFTISFHSNYVALSSYSITSRAGYRHIKSWDVFGIVNNKRYLIDRRTNEPICEDEYCALNTTRLFSCQYPGFFNKFMFVHTGLDSLNSSIFSMSTLKFYGIVTSNHAVITQRSICHNNNRIAITVITLLLS